MASAQQPLTFTLDDGRTVTVAPGQDGVVVDGLTWTLTPDGQSLLPPPADSYVTVDGVNHPLAPGQSDIRIDGWTYTHGDDGRWTTVPDGLTAAQFRVAVGDLADAKALVDRKSGDITEAMSAIRTAFGTAQTDWTSPSSPSMAAAMTWFTQAEQKLHSVLDEASRRLGMTHASYVNAEQSNYTNLLNKG